METGRKQMKQQESQRLLSATDMCVRETRTLKDLSPMVNKTKMTA